MGSVGDYGCFGAYLGESRWALEELLEFVFWVESCDGLDLYLADMAPQAQCFQERDAEGGSIVCFISLRI
jgi:hypothetical protein